MMQTWLKASEIVEGDVILQATAAVPELIFADRVIYVDRDENVNWVYLTVVGNRLRFRPTDTVTVLRGVSHEL